MVDVVSGDQQRLEASVQRLCVLADVRAPRCIVHIELPPLSYTVAPPGQTPTEQSYTTIAVPSRAGRLSRVRD